MFCLKENWKQFLYDCFKGNPYLKKILKNLYKRLFDNKKDEQRNVIFRSNALEVLKCFANCMDSNNISYTLAFGSMLGAVRDHGFIKHDLDIDVNIWYDKNNIKIKKCLESAGFKLKYSFSIEDNKYGLEETYLKDGVTIDIFYIYEAIDKYPYCCDFVKFYDSVDWTMSIKKHGGLLPRRLELPYSKERIMTDFETLRLYIPVNAHEILSLRYGADYMIPNPGWVNGFNNPNIIEWNDKLGVFTKYIS